MSTPYYTGDTVPLKFAVMGATPSGVKVVIQKPDGSGTSEVDGAVDGNTVSYNVPGSVTTQAGKYKAFFVCTLSYGERTHVMEFSVINNPV